MKTIRTYARHAVVAIAALACCGTARAVTPDWFGYLRTGIGSNNKGGDQVCFRLPGAGAKWRLGNECETFAEFGLGADLYEADGVKFNYKVMLDFLGGTNAGDEQNLVFDDNQRRIGLRQNYISVTGLGSGFMQDAAIWLGKRYYQRYDVHAMDFMYWNNSGNGLGIENIDIGVGKLQAAFIRIDQNTSGTNISDKGRTGNTVDLRLTNIPVNAGGELDLGVDFRFADQQDSAPVKDKGGNLFTIQHTQQLWGGFNRIAAQWGDDAGGAGGPNTYFNFTTVDQTLTRLVEHLVVAPTSTFSAMFAFVYQKTEVDGQGELKWTSVGARPMYHWTDYITSAVEVGYDTVKYTGGPADGATGKLTKLTIAPLILRPGRGAFVRPDLRLFATFAWWNDAANTAATATPGAVNLVGELPHDFTSGVKSGRTIGAQLEAWF